MESEKTDFKARKIAGDREGRSIMIKRHRSPERCAPNNRATMYREQELVGLEGDRGRPTFWLEASPWPLPVAEAAARQKLSSGTGLSTPTTGPVRPLLHIPPTPPEYVLFPNSHRTYTKVGCTLGHKINLDTFKIIEII